MREELGNAIDCMVKIKFDKMISCSISSGIDTKVDKKIHIATEDFLKLFPIHDVIDRGDGMYPTELSITIKDVKVYCITNQEELDSINNGEINV